MIVSKKFLNFFTSLSGDSLVIMTLLVPHFSKFSLNSFARLLDISFATSTPSFFSLLAIIVDLPPGAAHKSKTYSPGLISAMVAGYIADGSCEYT